MQLVEVSEERRYERPVGIDEPEAALQQADGPEADGYVGKEETVASKIGDASAGSQAAARNAARNGPSAALRDSHRE